MNEIIVDSEITLRPPEPADAGTLFALIDANREHLGRWLPSLGGVKSVEEERAWLQGQIDNPAGEKPFLIVIDGAVVGVIGAHGRTPNNSTEIGYWLAEGQQGRGITTRACAALVDDLIHVQGVNRVVIRVAVDNSRSRAVPERLGFVFEGVERQGIKLPDGYVDVAVYSMLVTEWRGAQEMGYVDRSGRPVTFGIPPILVDNRLMLRRPRVEDAAELFELLDANRDRLEWWSPWAPRLRDRSDAEQAIRSALQRDGAGGGHPLFAFDSGALIGAINMKAGGPDGNAVDVAYWIGGGSEGRGIMARLCRAAIDAAVPHFGLDQITIRTGAGNMRARSLAERLNLQMLRVDRGASATEDMIVYSISADDWAANIAAR